MRDASLPQALVRAVLLVTLAGCGPCDCSERAAIPQPAPELEAVEGPAGGEPRVALRYQPHASLEHTVHMVYELLVPGHGILRTSLSMDVRRAEQAADTTATEHVLTSYLSLSDGEPIALPTMVGLKFRELRRRNGSFVNTPAVDSPTVPAAVSRALTEYLKLGTLVEFSDRAVGVGESWTVPARNIEPAPGVVASLRPSFTLAGIDKSERDPVAEIDSDMEIDITPTPVAPGVVSKGSGTATGRFRVRLVDGVLLEASIELELSSEVVADDGAVIGFQEFPGGIHMWADAEQTPTDPAAHPALVKPRAEDASCVLSLSSMTQRMTHCPRDEPMVLGAALVGAELPSREGGAALDAAGGVLIAYADGSFLLDERLLGAEALPAALAGWGARAVDRPRLYVYADQGLDFAALAQRLKPLANKAELGLVVRDPKAKPMLPEPPGWFSARVLKAMAAPTLEARGAAIHELVRVSLGVCPPAMLAYQGALGARAGWQALREALPAIYTRCGCESTDLVALESAMYALGGTPDLRFIPLPTAQPGSVAEVLAKLPAPEPTPAPAKPTAGE